MFICLKKCVCVFFLNYKIYRESLKRNEINFKKENLKFTKKNFEIWLLNEEHKTNGGDLFFWQIIKKSEFFLKAGEQKNKINLMKNYGGEERRK